MSWASAALLVVVALQVQHAVHHQVRVVRLERLAPALALPPHHRRAQHDVAGQRALLGDRRR